jgi:hypothetical protein
MMPPDILPVPQEPLKGNQKDSKTISPYPSRIRNLLGLPNIGAVPLLSTISLPMVDLPYINSQMGIASLTPELWGSSQWAESEFDVLDNEDGGDLESLLTDSNQQPPLSEFSESPQKTSNNILGLTLPSTANSLSSSVSNNSSLEEDGNLTNSPTKSELKTTVSSEEPLSTVLAGNSTAENHYLANPLSEKALETEIKVENKDDEATQGTKLTPVDEETENPGSVLRSIPQKTYIIIPGLTAPSPSNSLSSSLSSDSSLEEEGDLTEPPTKSKLKTTVSSEEPLSTVLAGNFTAENHYLANPSSEKATETEIGVKSEGELTNNGTGRQTVLNLSNSQSKVKTRPQAKSTSPVISPQTDLIPELMTKKPMASFLVPIPETISRGEVTRSEYQKANSMVAQIEKLERTIADLSAEVAAQKDCQQPVIPQYPQPQVIVQRSVSQSKAPQAFWERSYVNRLYRWSLR